jgi:FeS assembly SUF system protein
MSEEETVEAPDQDLSGTEEATSTESRPADQVEYDVIAALKTVYDPEIPVDIYELGLIYKIDVSDAGSVDITMTLTTPMCPAAEILPAEVEAKAREVDGVSAVSLDLVWDPPWSMDMMSPAARLQLNV